MNWTWFHKLGSPKWFYQWVEKWSKWIFSLGMILFLIGIALGLAVAPEDYQQGNSVRIIYVHVPAAMLAQSCYLAIGIAGIVAIVWQMKMAPIFIKAVAPLGALMALLALLSGAIWGKPTWGTWWVWDARLTSVLILFLMYMGIIAIQNSFDDVILSDKAAAIIGIVGLINLPIIKYSVEWWNSLHQPATFSIGEKPPMPAEMWGPLLLSVLGLYCIIAGLSCWRMQTELLIRERRSNWVKKEVLKDGI